MALLSTVSWEGIEELRSRISSTKGSTVAVVAQEFCASFVSYFSSVVLARVFIVTPYAELPERDQSFARELVQADARLVPTTPVLSLLGSAGREPAWCDRLQSKAHLAIPLLDQEFVRGAPMIAKLLADLEVDLARLGDGSPIATRRMLGGQNGTFFVPDADVAVDGEGRPIIPGRDFVTKHDVKTVFGMGGGYADGTLAIAIVFASEALDRYSVERFPSFISTFKMLTTRQQNQKHIYE